MNNKMHIKWNMYSQSAIFLIWQLFVHGHPVTILVTALTTPGNSIKY